MAAAGAHERSPVLSFYLPSQAHMPSPHLDVVLPQRFVGRHAKAAQGVLQCGGMGAGTTCEANQLSQHASIAALECSCEAALQAPKQRTLEAA